MLQQTLVTVQLLHSKYRARFEGPSRFCTQGRLFCCTRPAANDSSYAARLPGAGVCGQYVHGDERM